jgi:ATP-dependent Clp protease ATP-binding subunit ClpC
VAWLAERGFEPAFGARPLRRAIQREVDNPLARLVLGSDLRAGQRVRVTVDDGALRFEVSDAEPNTVAEVPESADV